MNSLQHQRITLVGVVLFVFALVLGYRLWLKCGGVWERALRWPSESSSMLKDSAMGFVLGGALLLAGGGETMAVVVLAMLVGRLAVRVMDDSDSSFLFGDVFGAMPAFIIAQFVSG